MLGVGDFYYELGIQIVETCLVLQDQTGGLTDLEIIKKRIGKLRTRSLAEISEYGIVNFYLHVPSDDLNRAIGTLKPLGSGYAVVNLGSRIAVQSVPLELSADGTKLLSQAQASGTISRDICIEINWQAERFQRAIDSLVNDGLAWIDSQETVTLYWFPCFFKGFA